MNKLHTAIAEVSRYTLTPVIEKPTEYQELDFIELAELPKFDLANVHTSVTKAHAETRRWVKGVLENAAPYWLTLFGVPGCGKTMLAKLARHTLREKGHHVQLWNWPKVWRKCLDGEWGILDHLMSIPVLILDDVGAEFTGTNRTAELNSARLYEVAEGRLGKWTFITSNLTLEQMDRTLGSRFVSRIFRNNSSIVDLTRAEDYSFRNWKLNNNTQQ